MAGPNKTNGSGNWKKVFHKDNTFNVVLGRLGTMIIANFLFVIGCIPVVTIGVSLSALNAVMFDFQRNDDIKVLNVFLKAYKENFLEGLIGFILSTGFLSMGAVGLYFSFKAGNQLTMILGFVIFGALTLAALCFLAFYFGIISRYENDLPTQVKNGLIVGVAYVRWGVLIWLLWILCLAPFFIIPGSVIFVTPIFAMFGFSFMAYVSTRIQRRVFRLVDDREITDEY